MTNKEFIEDISLDGEVWRDVVGFEGLYMISSMGRIISLEKYANNRFSDVRKPPRLLTPVVQKDGSLKIMLSRSGEIFSKRIPTMVAEAFLVKPFPEAFVRRKNGDPSDNRLENIEWAMPKDRHAVFETASLAGEEWKDIKGFEEIYQVSNLGRIKSVPRSIPTTRGFFHVQERILVPFIAGNGYQCVSLVKNQVKRKHYIHRIVGEAFLDNPECLPEIDHINGDRTDNRSSNLRWCDHRTNQNNPITRKRASEALKGKLNNPTSRPVVLLKDGELVERFPSIAETARRGHSRHFVGVSCKEGVVYNGFRWMYLDDYNTLINKSKNSSIS